MTGETASFETDYKAFEDRFRGSRELIRQRLSVYLPLLGRLDADEPNARRALDIGSGRGEWLALIAEHGWQGHGVDSNASFAASAKDLGVATDIADGLSFLRGCEDASFALVTAFHVVEHVGTDYRADLLAEIRRVLTPGGLMIIETPNPQNLTVGSWSFHLDPTHKSPIPPPLLQYQVEAAGFPAGVALLLNGELGGGEGPLSQILSVLFRSGPDYAILALRVEDEADKRMTHLREFAAANSQPNPADITALYHLADRGEDRVLDIEVSQQRATAEMEEHFRSVSKAFGDAVRLYDAEIGSFRRALAEDATRVEKEMASLVSALDAQRRHVEAEIALPLKEEVAELRAALGDQLVHVQEHIGGPLNAEIDHLKKARAADLTKLESKNAQLLAVYRSRSWQMTAPLRAAGRLLRTLRKAPKNVARRLLEIALDWSKTNPRYKPIILRLIGTMPWLKRRLLSFSGARRRGRSGKLPAPRWTIDPDPTALREWNRLLGVD